MKTDRKIYAAIAAAGIVLAAAGIALGLGLTHSNASLTASGTVAGVTSDSAYTVMEAGIAGSPPDGLCDITAGAQVTITNATGHEVAWTQLRTGTVHGQGADTLTFTVPVPAGSDHYGVAVAGIQGTLSVTPAQLTHVSVGCQH